MKVITEQQVDDIIKLKFGSATNIQPSKSFLSNRFLGKLFGISGSKVRQLYLTRLEQQ